MAIQDYVYSIQDDFVINHKVDLTVLQEEIITSTIVTEVHHVYSNLEEDECQIWFFDALTQDEESELDVIIAAHTGELAGGVTPGEIGDFDVGQGDISITFGDDVNKSYINVTDPDWATISRFLFRGTNDLGVPVGVNSILRSKDIANSSKTSGLRLYDVTNSAVIFSWIFHTTGWKICAQNVTTFPSDASMFELQGKKDGGECYLSNFVIQFSGIIVDNMN